MNRRRLAAILVVLSFSIGGPASRWPGTARPMVGAQTPEPPAGAGAGAGAEMPTGPVSPGGFEMPPGDASPRMPIDFREAEATKQKIKASLRGEASATESDGSLLGGVLEFIEREGSLLRGSLLERSLAEETVHDEMSANELSADGATSAPLARGSAGGRERSTRGGSAAKDDDAMLAELLLRAARLLQRKQFVERRSSAAAGEDSSTRALVEAMRHQAAELLRDDSASTIPPLR